MQVYTCARIVGCDENIGVGQDGRHRPWRLETIIGYQERKLRPQDMAQKVTSWQAFAWERYNCTTEFVLAHLAYYPDCGTVSLPGFAGDAEHDPINIHPLYVPAVPKELVSQMCVPRPV